MRFIPISWDPGTCESNAAMHGFFGFTPSIGLHAWGITIFQFRTRFSNCLFSLIGSLRLFLIYYFELINVEEGAGGWPLVDQC